MDKNPLLVILGPTASGKTKLAVDLATVLNGQIISADSRQVFKGMDLGTGKDLEEYVKNGKTVRHHLIDIKEAGQLYNVNEFKENFYEAFKAITNIKMLPILCGGTGMYVHSVLQHHEYTAVPVNDALRHSLSTLQIDALRNKLITYPDQFTAHADQSSGKRMIRAIEIAEYLLNNELQIKDRPLIDSLVIGLKSDIVLRRQKIINRLELRLKNGMVDEVRGLIDKGISKDILTFYGLEYKFIAAYLFNEMSFKELKEKLSIAICQFAKRQMTFFRKMEKDGVKINWLDAENPEKLFTNALQLYNHQYNSNI